MSHKHTGSSYGALIISLSLSCFMLLTGMMLMEGLSGQKAATGLLRPLLRLLLFIGAGLAAGRIIERSGWTKYPAALAAPFFRFSNLGHRCSAAFTTAFFSGVAANAMLLEFYKEDKISRRQLFLSNFINQFPAYFLHLPTTVFIVLPLTKTAGALYFLITFSATLFRTILFFIYGNLRLPAHDRKTNDDGPAADDRANRTTKGLLEGLRETFPRRMAGIVVYVVPVYIFIFLLNHAGWFDKMRVLLAGHATTTVIPVEALSMVVLSFAAEFASGFAAAGALLDAGVVTVKQAVSALLLGNIIAFPVRALRHQLPRYIGIFSPKTGIQLLIMGQSFRIASLVFIGAIYFFIG